MDWADQTRAEFILAVLELAEREGEPWYAEYLKFQGRQKERLLKILDERSRGPGVNIRATVLSFATKPTR
jgi:hypothetical protein